LVETRYLLIEIKDNIDARFAGVAEVLEELPGTDHMFSL